MILSEDWTRTDPKINLCCLDPVRDLVYGGEPAVALGVDTNGVWDNYMECSHVRGWWENIADFDVVDESMSREHYSRSRLQKPRENHAHVKSM